MCIVDAKLMGYQCVNYKKEEKFIPLDDYPKLLCSSPYDTEEFLKACQKGEIIQVTVCEYGQDHHFICTAPDGTKNKKLIEQVDNYACVSPHHRKRIEERCGSS